MYHHQLHSKHGGMAKRARTSAYSASDLHRAVEATRANATVTDSLSSDEETAQASRENQTSVKRPRRTKKGRNSQAADGSRVIQEEVEFTSYVRNSAPGQAEAVTMDDLLPLLNGASGNSTSDLLDDDEEVDQLAEASDQYDGGSAAPAPAALKAVVAPQSTAEGRQTATPTPAQQSPPKRKRGRPSKADIAAKQILAQTSATGSTSGSAIAPPPSGLPLPATSSRKRKRLLKNRRESSTPAVEVQDSLFATQDVADSAAQDEQENALFRSPSVESESPPPPASGSRLDSNKRKHANGAGEEPAKKLKQTKVKATAKDKGKARAISPEPVQETATSNGMSDSSSEEEEEVQNSLVQDLPKRQSARRQNSKTSEVAAAGSPSKAKASTAKKTSTRKSTAAKTAVASTSAATPAKTTAAKAPKTTAPSAVATPVASGSGPAAGTAPPSASALMPTPSANRPKWIRERIRKLTIQQHKNFLAHRTRGPDRARGNPWSEDEEITLILALNDMYIEGAALGNQTAQDIIKNQYKRWRNIQEQHGVNGSLSDILS